MPEVVKGFLDLLQSFRGILVKGGKVFFYSYAFENFSTTTRDLPPLSRREAITTLRAAKGFSLSIARFKGYLQGRDKVIILRKRG